MNKGGQMKRARVCLVFLLLFIFGFSQAVPADEISELKDLVKTLINKTLPFGRYEVVFSAKDLPSGEYYYVMKGAKHTQIRKMKLIK